MVSVENIDVEVAYAKPEEQVILKVQGDPGMTVLQAIELSRIVERFPEIDPATAKVGIFGKAAKQDTELQAGDRVEIYRELIADPKAARKKKAAAKEKKEESGE
jgi:putative ubiquitin-RnfH superfamily antitoxin RatB of RatAB toxin-antitoxin module